MTMSETDILPTRCTLCPRCCKANRREGQRGICGAGSELTIARAALHQWEEPPISVGAGSGTVFFSNCPLRCVYCQNGQIACGAHGLDVSIARLGEIFWELKEQGAANINLVTPSHYFPQIKKAHDKVCDQGFDLPFIMNTSGYELKRTIQDYASAIDVYLCDIKYASSSISDAAKRYSQAPDYFERAIEALDTMVCQQPEIHYDIFCGERRIRRGVVVRHLMLPGRLEESKEIVAFLWRTYHTQILYSFMNQYTPVGVHEKFPELSERVCDSDYEALLDFADSLGMEEYFWQEGDAAQESFIPAFDYTGVRRQAQ